MNPHELQQKQLDEQYRLECLKLSAPLHPRLGGFGDEPPKYVKNVQLDADKYYSYIKERKISD